MINGARRASAESSTVSPTECRSAAKDQLSAKDEMSDREKTSSMSNETSGLAKNETSGFAKTEMSGKKTPSDAGARRMHFKTFSAKQSQV